MVSVISVERTHVLIRAQWPNMMWLQVHATVLLVATHVAQLETHHLEARPPKKAAKTPIRLVCASFRFRAISSNSSCAAWRSKPEKANATQTGRNCERQLTFEDVLNTWRGNIGNQAASHRFQEYSICPRHSLRYHCHFPNFISPTVARGAVTSLGRLQDFSHNIVLSKLNMGLGWLQVDRSWYSSHLS